MKRGFTFTLSVALILLVSGCSIGGSKNPELKNKKVELQESTSIVGCYVAKLKKDVFILNITKQESQEVEAKIEFKNAEKDSSNGKLVGTYDGTILTGIYTFASEGTTSRSELFFKRFGEGFREGFGPAEMKGDLSLFTRPLNIRWDDSFTFNKSTECQP
jgi:hypothetical protein